jgi:hypothetical protein
MPKFGTEIDTIIIGLAKLLLIMGLSFKDSLFSWFREIIRPNWEVLSQILNSAYLSPEVIDSKVRYVTVLYKNLYRYSEDSFKASLRQEFIANLYLVMDRFSNGLLTPLTKYDLVQHQPLEY